MVNYVLRRVLLMIPTLIGITFVVFMLIAMSPGGIGAGLQPQAGGAMQSQSGVAVQRAKIDDRYGLNEGVFTQYFRWLGRISPIKFGQRDLVNPSGDLITAPRPVPEPAVWTWYAQALPAVDPSLRTRTRDALRGQADAPRATAFRDIEREYIAKRADFTTKDAELRDLIVRYIEVKDAQRTEAEIVGNDARAAELADWQRNDLVDGQMRPRVGRLAALPLDPASPLTPKIKDAGAAALAAWQIAADAREALLGGMAAEPYPAAGIGLGPVSLAWPDFGVSFSNGQRVLDRILHHLPTTILLNLISIPIIYLIAIPSGMLAATRRGSWYDVGLGSLYIGLYSIPVVLAGVLMVGFLTSPDYLAWFPTSGLHDQAADTFTYLPFTDEAGVWHRGYLLDMAWHVVLPVLCLTYGGFAILSKQTRAAMLENFSADYVRTAKAKGVTPLNVVLVHVFRNSLLPLITMFVAIFPAMLAGSVVIERIFTIQGMGWLVIEAINLRDREMILANTTMIAVVNMLALLLADILYAAADPRVTYQ